VSRRLVTRNGLPSTEGDKLRLAQRKVGVPAGPLENLGTDIQVVAHDLIKPSAQRPTLFSQGPAHLTVHHPRDLRLATASVCPFDPFDPLIHVNAEPSIVFVLDD
jgi:hypothetical protein